MSFSFSKLKIYKVPTSLATHLPQYARFLESDYHASWQEKCPNFGQFVVNMRLSNYTVRPKIAMIKNPIYFL